MKPFTHLHVHSEYSVLDGLGKPEKIFERAKELGFKAIAITDHGNMDAYVKCIQASKKTGVKYIPGVEFYIVDDIREYQLAKGKDLRRVHLTAYATQRKGIDALFRLLSIANSETNYYKKPLLEWDDLLNEDLEGIRFGTACTSGLLGQEDYKEIITMFTKEISNNLFLEVMPHNFPPQLIVNKRAIEISEDFALPLVATNDNHYIDKQGSYHQEVLLAIQRKAKWNDPKRWRFDVKDLYMKTEEEMFEAFEEQGVLSGGEIKKALANSYIIADGINIKYSPQKVLLPKVYPDSKKSDEEILIDLCTEGFEKKINSLDITDEEWKVYKERLIEETDLICNLGFERYFLLVEDFVRWAKENDILVGAGRGSVGGSLVAYVLDITGVDPIKYKLLFARFISPARIDLPDIDLDFEDAKRERVKQYLKDKYGADCVCGVATFSEMHGRGALRDTSRVFDVPLGDVDKAAKSIVVRSGGDVRADFSLEDAFETFEEGKAFKRKYPKVTKTAIALEGTVRNTGIHAAGTVVSNEPLNSGRHGYICCKRRGEKVVNWEKEDLEYMGLMKLDILGLNTLTILKKCAEYVKEHHGKDIDFYAMTEFDDKKILDEFVAGNTIGIFQFGSYGIQKLCSEIGVEEFKDLVDINALYRPGTLRSGLVREYIRRKKGETKYKAPHPDIAELTKDTYGVILYQEQIMNLLYNIGGLQWKTTDMVRKVISKSKGVEQFGKFKDMFVKGAMKRTNLKKAEAEKIFEELKHFGSYGFNLSHAVEYTIIAWWCMFCKVYYPLQYMQALLSYSTKDKEGYQFFIDETIRLGLKIEPVDINISSAIKWEANDDKLYAPFCAVRGLGEKGCKEIIKGRGKKPYKNEKDFIERVNRRVLNIRVRKALQGAGAYRRFEKDFDLSASMEFYDFAWIKDKQYQRWDKFVKESYPFGALGEHNPEKGLWYFGQMAELKFGYKQKLDAQRNKKESFEGGVYGYIKNIDGEYGMVTFDTSLYQKRKYEIEHCVGQYLLVKGGTIIGSNNLVSVISKDIYTEAEFASCSVPLKIWGADDGEDFKINQCNLCELRNEARKIIPTEYNTNIMILGEAPGREEDRNGRPFWGDAGKLLFNKLKRRGVLREDVTIANCAKCYPSKTKTPKDKHLSACTENHLFKEFESIQPVLVLALGNTALKVLRKEEKGIRDLSGKVEWSSRFNFWVCYGVHPASVLYNRAENEELFDKALSVFVDKIRILSGG